MPEMKILMGDGEQLEFRVDDKVHETEVSHAVAIPRGMSSGKAAVAFVGRLKDGSYAYLQTSMRLLFNAAAAWRAKYGDEADGSGQTMNAATQARLQAILLYRLVSDREGGRFEIDIDELNAIMQDPDKNLRVEYDESGKRLTLTLE